MMFAIKPYGLFPRARSGSLRGPHIPQISSKDFGVKDLSNRLGQFTGELLQIKSMLEDFEGFLNLAGGMG
jgi:hypothetical protein